MLAPGSCLGPYQVLAPLGSGGMGEVHRARDLRLNRDVAIKVLRSDVNADETRRQRFVQEARAASALNHPNIVAIYEIDSIDGMDFIVMELVPGQTLREVIRSKMTVPQICRISVQIADALGRAHAAGIVHRDLKPANVMVTPDGQVKILDFGLAKLLQPAAPPSLDAKTQMATTAASLSQTGAIMGSPGYMSPEQATGGAVDARSDIFSFGAILYEMVTGQRAFPGDSLAELLRRVVQTDPAPPSTVAPGIPHDLERVIERCLRKDPSRRLQHILDAKVELLDIEERLRTILPAPPRRTRNTLRAAAAGLVVLFVVTILSWRTFRPATTEVPARIVPLTTAAGSEATPALSPDGRQVAYSWEGERRVAGAAADRDIWLTIVGGGAEVRRVTSGPDDDWAPTWSPDGTQLAYLRFPHAQPNAPGTVNVVSPLGGSARMLDTLRVRYSQLSWSPDGRWLAAPRLPEDTGTSHAGGIHLMPVDGGATRPLTVPQGLGFHFHPAFSFDGQHLAYAACNWYTTPSCDVYVMALGPNYTGTTTTRQLTQQKAAIHGIAWAPDGHSVVYASSPSYYYGTGIGSQLWRVAVDGRSPPERIEAARLGSFAPATVAAAARLVFAQDRSDIDIFRFDPSGPSNAIVASSFVDYGPSFSPDGRRIAFESSRSGEGEEIWVADPDGANAVQITRSPRGGTGPPAWRGGPAWSPDGQWILYSVRGGGEDPDLWMVGANGGAPRRVTHDEFLDGVAVWSRDGRWIYYRQDRPDGRDIVRIPATGGSATERITRRGALYLAESADGTTLFYTKTEGTSPLFRLSLASRVEHQVEECVMARALAAAGSGLYFIGCGPGQEAVPLYKISLATGHKELVGRVERGSGIFMGLAVSPDEKTILFARAVAEGSDLVLFDNFR